MKTCLLLLLILADSTRLVEPFGLAEMISNYAKVRTSQTQAPTTTSKPTATMETGGNVTSGFGIVVEPLDPQNETDIPDYEDFDDLQESENRTAVKPPLLNAQTMMTVFSGLLNLMAMMNAEPRGLADDVNSLEEARYHPTTATKKFKQQTESESQPVDTYPPYNPYSSNKAESYGEGDVKTSYDADREQYEGAKKPEKMETKEKSPMTDYMNQNVVIQPSYSYEIPYEPVKENQPWENLYKVSAKFPVYQPPSKPWGAQEQPWYKKPEEDPYMKKKNPSPESSYPVYAMDDEDDHPYPMKAPPTEDDDHYPVYSPPKYAKKPPPSPPEDDEDDHPGYPVYAPVKPGKMPLPPPPEDDEDDHPSYPAYTPPKSAKKPPPPPPEDDEDDHPGYPAYTPPKSAKRPPPPPPEDDEDDHPSYYSSPKGKKPPPPEAPEDDHEGLYYPVYDHDFHHEDEHKDDKAVEDEDRESKHPYSYYYLGRKLWYVPLLFSLYFIIYIGALILKAVARHKIQFPDKLWELHGSDTHNNHRRNRRIQETAARVGQAIETVGNRYKYNM